MNTNKLVDEDIARTKQLQEMEMIRDSILEKIAFLEEERVQLQKQIEEKSEHLETKTSKLGYIRDVKEAVFNSFQNALEENRTLKNQTNKKEATHQKKKSRGILGSVFSYFKRDEFDSIDVSNGKIAKTNVKVDIKNIDQNFDKIPDSIFVLNPDVSAKSFKSSQQTTSFQEVKDEPQQKLEETTEILETANFKEEELPKDELAEHDHDTEFVAVEDHEELIRQLREFDVVPN